MLTPLETRMFGGHSRPEDAEWVEFLDAIFKNVSLQGFTNHGMDYSCARRLVNLLAMAKRVAFEIDRNPFKAEDGQSDDTGEHFFSSY